MKITIEITESTYSVPYETYARLLLTLTLDGVRYHSDTPQHPAQPSTSRFEAARNLRTLLEERGTWTPVVQAALNMYLEENQ